MLRWCGWLVLILLFVMVNLMLFSCVILRIGLRLKLWIGWFWFLIYLFNMCVVLRVVFRWSWFSLIILSRDCVVGVVIFCVRLVDELLEVLVLVVVVLVRFVLRLIVDVLVIGLWCCVVVLCILSLFVFLNGLIVFEIRCY